MPLSSRYSPQVQPFHMNAMHLRSSHFSHDDRFVIVLAKRYNSLFCLTCCFETLSDDACALTEKEYLLNQLKLCCQGTVGGKWEEIDDALCSSE